MVRPADWVCFWRSWSYCFCWAGFDTDIIARDWAKVDPDSLSERIARSAAAIKGCSAHFVSKYYWKQAEQELADEPDTDPNESAPDFERWLPVSGSTGHNVPVARHGFRTG
jgi:hypothetical protein